MGGSYTWCTTLNPVRCVLRTNCPNVCSETNLSACNRSNCEIYAGNWCASGTLTSFSCKSEESGCCTSNTISCSRSQCDALGAKWCVLRGGDTPVCTNQSQMRECCVGSVAGCASESDCDAVGGTWSGSACADSNKDPGNNSEDESGNGSGDDSYKDPIDDADTTDSES